MKQCPECGGELCPHCGGCLECENHDADFDRDEMGEDPEEDDATA